MARRNPLIPSLLLASVAVLQGADDPTARAALPLYQVIPAAPASALTPTDGGPDPAKFRTWTASHGDPGARRYSALRQINRENVHRLQPAWIYRSGDGARNVQANPIVVDGVLYGPTAGRAIVALDAATGSERWRYQVEAPAQLGLEDAPARRGLVYWPGRDGIPPRLVFASGRWLYALDPATGEPLASFGEGGRVPLPTGGTAVGTIFADTYIVPGLWGDVFSFDLVTGRQLWRFHTIPRDGEFGADTWRGPVRDGAHPWGGMALDEHRGIAYIAVGAARPDFIGVDRLGDNLFSNCLVALDARTGSRLWHFQHVRHDIWDLDNPAPPNLVTVEREGRRVDAVACLTKEGGTLLLDRVTGEPLFPFRLRRAPASTLPGEQTAPYQPFPELPEPLSSPEVRLEDITDRSPEAHAFVLRQVERSTYGWFEPPRLGVPMLYRSSRGGPEWTGAAVDVPTGRLYVSTNHLLGQATVHLSDEQDRDPALPPSSGETVFQQLCAACHGDKRQGLGMVPSLVGLRHRRNDASVTELLRLGGNGMPAFPLLEPAERAALLDFLMRRNQPPPAPTARRTTRYFAVGYKFVTDHEGYPGSKPPWGQLQCLDLNTGRILWRKPLGVYPELLAQGLPPTGTQNFGGPTVTAGGLVFVAGTRDEMIRAFDADTGEELWSAQLPFGGYAPPTVYEAGGRQFVVIAATGGGKMNTKEGDSYAAFALPVDAIGNQ
ncbi:pyrroloquinoline quinone-dependent dehydrogenase [Oleiharenicola lentus]|uniref:Pyrroloquinoline quinone-dependent dehydrogenase n=1 Tax=Oleiharenicola lentus TaxID=2508720 RepID=A0A4V1M6M2_9BACT|nr:PQQ-binding-like beta-propeller repeat protein [Oleiharenicola lentus]RXK55889.1 pyrroloquinoline quinone-dependent dehydrogenase [Oleiharenicola lentus]